VGGKMRVLGIVAPGAALSGCASSAADIALAYVSPVAYQSCTCQQLTLEAQAISIRAATLSGAQEKQRTNDGLATDAPLNQGGASVENHDHCDCRSVAVGIQSWRNGNSAVQDCKTGSWWLCHGWHLSRWHLR
jgi:hypothetical protein